MTAPTYGATSSRTAAGRSTAATTITIPAGIVKNSVIVVFIHRDRDRDTTYQPYDALPDGFAYAPNSPTIAIGDDQTIQLDVFWKRATGPEDSTGTYNFGWTRTATTEAADTSYWRVGFSVRIDGCRTTGNPFEDDNGAASVADDTDTPAVSVTTLGADRLLLWVGSSYSTGTWTVPASFTPQVVDVDFDLLAAATLTQALAGSSGSLVGTQDSRAHSAWVGAFVPADGRYFTPVSPGASTTSGALGNETLHVAPWQIDDDVTLNGLAVDVTVDGEPGCTVRPAIYTDDDGVPGALLVDGGALAADAIATPEGTVSTTLAAGRVWIGGVVQDAPTTEPTIRIIDTATTAAPVTSIDITDAVGVVVGYSQAAVSGALPDPFVPSGVSSTVPRVIARTT